LASLPEEIDELILVVGGPYEQAIRDYFGENHGGRKINYVRQEEPKGLGHAIQQAKGIARGRFLTINPDDIYEKSDLKRMLAEADLAALAYKHSQPQNFGVFVCDNQGYIQRTVEKPKEFVSDLVSAGASFLLDEEFFEVTVPPSARGEIELPDLIQALITQRNRKFKVIETSFWIPVNDPEQLDLADKIIQEKLGVK